MKRIFALTMILAAFTISSCRRDNNRVPDYLQVTFTEEFDDNYNGWNFSDVDYQAYGVIDGGAFTMGYFDDLEAYYISMDIGFNRFNDFTIQTRFGSDNNMGVLFGYNLATGSYGYSFTIDQYGNFALYDEGGNGYGENITELVPLSTASFVRGGGDYNEVMIRQVGSRWIGFINGTEAFNIAAQQLKAGSIGYVLTSNTIGQADYLQVDWYQ